MVVLGSCAAVEKLGKIYATRKERKAFDTGLALKYNRNKRTTIISSCLLIALYSKQELSNYKSYFYYHILSQTWPNKNPLPFGIAALPNALRI